VAGNYRAKQSSPRHFIIATANATNADGTSEYHLGIRLNCLLTKVRFQNDHGKLKAIGADFLDGKSLYSADPPSHSTLSGTPGQVNVTREVDLSAGTYNTAQLLKISGIGPKEGFSERNIPVLLELPGIGSNLQDRYEVSVIGDTKSDFEVWNGCTFGNFPDPCFEEWQNGNGTNNGPYADNGLVIFVKKSSSVLVSDSLDLIVGGAPLPFKGKGYYPGCSRDSVSSKRRFSWVILKAHTRNNSRTVTLRSANPRDTPLINFRYFDEGTREENAVQLDLEALTERVEFSRSIFQKTMYVNGSTGCSETWPDLLPTRQINQGLDSK